MQDDAASLHRVASPDTPPLHDDPDDHRPRLKDGDERAGGEDLKSGLHQTRKFIADLVRESVESKASGKKEPALERSFSFTRSGEIAAWKAPARTLCESLLVTNEGPSIAKDIRVLIDGKSPATTLRELAERAVQSLADETQKATALWKAIVDGRRHDWPAHKEAEDPVKLLGVYGYGFCSHAAHALAALARESGMQARVLHAKGKHLVTEIMVDEKWAVFDADAETHYPMPDGSLASAEDLRHNPNLLSAAPSGIYSE
ncbi:MAG: transglutaminase domain-containing protein, partial [Chthoniobacterales bacterium]